MIKKTDSLKAGLKPLLAKTLENALSHLCRNDSGSG